MTTVYFATNRQNNGTGQFGYGSSIIANDPSKIVYAAADVENIQLPDEESGKITSIHDQHTGNFSDAIRGEIIGANRNLMIFIHGANNSFEDAIKRGAFNREWFADSGQAAANTTVVAFTWPSNNKYFGTPHTPQDAYLADQVQAGKSGFHLVAFLKNVVQLKHDFTTAHPKGRVFLLAHSMGNYALQGAIQSWFDMQGPNEMIFDQVFLAAPDEVANTFIRPHGGRLTNLPNLSDRISVYFSRRDILMILSGQVNGDNRLGGNGPENKLDAKIYPASKFRLVDCTDVLDFPLFPPFDASHQYYRRSPTARADIVQCMVDHPRPDGGIVPLSTLSAPTPPIS